MMKTALRNPASFVAFLYIICMTHTAHAAMATSVFTEDNAAPPPGDAITISNSLTSAADISVVVIDLANSLGDVVFDPNDPSPPTTVSNVIGDAGFLDPPTYSEGFLSQGRTVFQILTLNFADFGPGEEVLVNLDVDADDGLTSFVTGDQFEGATISITFLDDLQEVTLSGTYESSGPWQATATVVPIPSAALLLGSGLVGLLVVRRRDKSTNRVA